MREVGLVHEVVRIELRCAGEHVALEPEARIDLTPEVLARQQVVFRMFFAYARVVPLPVDRLDQRWHPTCTALHRHEIELRKPMAHTAADDFADAERVADESERRYAREPRLQSHLALVERLAVAHTERCLSADVEADRKTDLLCHRPDRIPMRIRERRLFEILRLTRKQNRSVTERFAAFD